MTIDLRNDFLAFRAYLCRLVAEHIKAGKPKPKFIVFGFTFDQDAWISTYFDSRPNASCDGEWTTRISPETLLRRPDWHAASEILDQRNVNIIGVDGRRLSELAAHPDFNTFANILGEFIKSTVDVFIHEGVFRLLLGTEHVEYYVEEFSGLYGWPQDPKKVKFAESLRARLRREEGLDP